MVMMVEVGAADIMAEVVVPKRVEVEVAVTLMTAFVPMWYILLQFVPVMDKL